MKRDSDVIRLNYGELHLRQKLVGQGLADKCDIYPKDAYIQTRGNAEATQVFYSESL